MFERNKFIKQRVREIKRMHVKQWANNWTIYLRIMHDSSSTQTKNINKKRLKLHVSLRKTESSLITQIRTKKIDFVDFLFRRKVLEIDSSTCRCEWRRQTIKHVIMFCSLMIDRNQMMRDVDHFDYNRMMHSTKSLKIIIKWLINQNILTQYALITKLISIEQT